MLFYSSPTTIYCSVHSIRIRGDKQANDKICFTVSKATYPFKRGKSEKGEGIILVIYIYIYIYVYIYIYSFIYIYIFMFMFIYLCLYIYTNINSTKCINS